jgi:hypothetical protein
MSILMILSLASGCWNADVRSVPLAAPAAALLEGDGQSAQGTERLVLRKDGGPGHGPDQPYDVREQGATDLEGFVGGKYIVFVGPWDVIILALIVLIIVLIIVL